MTAGVVGRGAVLSRSVAGFVAVCSPAGDCVELAGSAVAVWEALPELSSPPVHVGVLVDRLAAAHAADVSVVAADVAAVLGVLIEAGCVVAG